MSPAVGRLASHGPSQAMGMFEIDGAQVTVVVTLGSEIDLFNASSATITYGDASELKNTHPFSGTIGETTFSFTFQNGPQIQGKLDLPMSSTNTVHGTGTWSQSE